jgi:hypothetical protein
MKYKRWRELMADDGHELTEAEIQAGWHFCWDWDGLLIGPGMDEMAHCNCVQQAELNER